MARKAATATDYEQRLLRAQQLLAECLDEPIDPARLARAAHFSLHHFHRIFRAQMGESVMQHVRRLRLERAARRMRNSDARLLDLALEAGYESHEAFTRAFSERFGLPPSEFREQPAHRASAWQAQVERAPSVEVRARSEPELRVAFMRHRGSYATVGETWQKMLAWARKGELLGPQTRLFGVCPDDPDVTEESFLRFDACLVVPEEFSDPEVAVTRIPSGAYAVGVHVGPYDTLHETYLDIIGRWFPNSGYELAEDPVIEHYLNDPASTPASQLRTEVRVRVAED